MIHLSHHEEGQGLVEYALILVLVAIVVIAAVTIFGNDLLELYNDVYQEFLAF